MTLTVETATAYATRTIGYPLVVSKAYAHLVDGGETVTVNGTLTWDDGIVSEFSMDVWTVEGELYGEW